MGTLGIIFGLYFAVALLSALLSNAATVAVVWPIAYNFIKSGRLPVRVRAAALLLRHSHSKSPLFSLCVPVLFHVCWLTLPGCGLHPDACRLCRFYDTDRLSDQPYGALSSCSSTRTDYTGEIAFLTCIGVLCGWLQVHRLYSHRIPAPARLHDQFVFHGLLPVHLKHSRVLYVQQRSEQHPRHYECTRYKLFKNKKKKTFRCFISGPFLSEKTA
jgi:hypothetical protein